MTISINKTEAIILKGKLKRKPVCRYNNKPIAFKKQVKYLGIVLDEKLNFLPHTKYITKKVKNLFWRIRNCFGHNMRFGAYRQKIFYNTLFQNLVLYGSIVLK